MKRSQINISARDQVNSIARVLNIIECFAFEKAEWSLSDLAEQTGLPNSTLHRQLSTLVAAGYLKQDSLRGFYQIDNRFLLLACSLMSKFDLRMIARPHLEQLSEKTGETVHLCMLSGFDMFYVEKIESQYSVSCNSQIGSRLPAHVASAGKVLLSGQSDSFLREYIKEIPNMPVFTKHTITDPDLLISELVAVQKNGYALDHEESEEGLVCVAAPVRNMDQQIIAAVSVSGPSFRFADQIEKALPHLYKCTAEISRLLGYTK